MVSAKSTLQTGSAYLQTLLDSIDESVVATDQEFAICYWNKKAEQLFGYPKERALGTDAFSTLEFGFSIDTKKIAQAMLLAQGSWKGQLRYKNSEGKTTILDTSVTAIRNESGDITGYVAVYRERKTLAQVREPHPESSLFQTFMENSPIMSWIMDKNGVINYLNPSCMKTFHLTPAAVGQPMDAVFPSSLSLSFQENNAIVYKLKQPIKTIENAAAPDGLERIYQVIKFPIETEDGVFIGGWAIDMTEESQLRRSLSESLDKLKQSEKHLKDALVKEHNLNDMKSRFVSMASHEFRTPLSTILSSIYLLEKYTTTEQQVNRLKHSGKIKEAIQHLNNLLEDFLTLGKLEEGKTSVKLSPFDAYQLLTDVMEELEPIKKTGQVVQLDFTGNRQVTSDKQILRNIMINLLNNAIKFSGENKYIAVQVNRDSSRVTIVVKDQGIGISDADQEHLFQTFFRGKNAQNIQGTGLGLNIVKQYLDMLKGSIQIESELNKGTAVTISFPATDPA